MSVTTFDLMRHGEPEGGRKFRGALDDPLSVTGWAQMRAAVADARPWDLVLSSPLRRCAEFAAELAARHELPLTVVPELREIGFGAWEGLRVREVEARYGEALARFWRDAESYTPPGAEPIGEFDRRIAAAWAQMQAVAAGRHALVVCHGGVIRLLLRQVLGLPLARIWRLDVPYAALSRVEVHPEPDGSALPVLVFHAGRVA